MGAGYGDAATIRVIHARRVRGGGDVYLVTHNHKDITPGNGFETKAKAVAWANSYRRSKRIDGDIAYDRPRARRARKNPKPLLSPTEEKVVVVLGIASLIGIAYYVSTKNQPSGNALATTTPGA